MQQPHFSVYVKSVEKTLWLTLNSKVPLLSNDSFRIFVQCSAQGVRNLTTATKNTPIWHNLVAVVNNAPWG